MFGIDIAFRSRSEAVSRHEQFLRVWRHGTTVFGLSGSATRDGYTVWPDASAAFLDACEAGFVGHGPEALHAVFEAASAWVAQRLPPRRSDAPQALPPEMTGDEAAGMVDPEDLDRSGFDLGALTDSGFRGAASIAIQPQGPTAWLTAFVVSNGVLNVRWCGGDELWLIDDQGLRFRTVGHQRRVRPTAPHPNIVSRGLGTGYENALGPQSAEASSPPGCRLVLASRTVAQDADPQAVVVALRNAPIVDAAQRVLKVTGWHPGAIAARVAVIDL